MSTKNIEGEAKKLVDKAAGLRGGGLETICRIQAGLVMLIALCTINRSQNDDPEPLLRKAISDAMGILSAAHLISPELALKKNMQSVDIELDVGRAIDLFETAWTTYTPSTYDHSVGLVKQRLINSGFNEKWFAGKHCFDGGCGTGRLTIAMAQMGASNVTAVDLGGESLDYLRQVVARYGLSNIEIVQHDVTDLSPWEGASYDFVASNGVLHHTDNCERGIREHFRITKPGGIFWVYLYGAGGIYWRLYDTLKPMVVDIPPIDIRRILAAFGLREGLIYTYLDNFLAPRVYYTRDQFLQLLKEEGEFTWRHAKGMSEIDDTEILMKTAYGTKIYGPEGEVRLIVTKL